MITRTYTPRPPLSRFVDFFWFQEGLTPAHARERVLPSGTMELIIGLQHEMLRVYDGERAARAREMRGTAVCGAHAEFFVIDTASQASIKTQRGDEVGNNRSRSAQVVFSLCALCDSVVKIFCFGRFYPIPRRRPLRCSATPMRRLNASS